MVRHCAHAAAAQGRVGDRRLGVLHACNAMQCKCGQRPEPRSKVVFVTCVVHVFVLMHPPNKGHVNHAATSQSIMMGPIAAPFDCARIPAGVFPLSELIAGKCVTNMCYSRAAVCTP